MDSLDQFRPIENEKSNAVNSYLSQINVAISRFLRLTWCLVLTLLAELIFNWSRDLLCVDIAPAINLTVIQQCQFFYFQINVVISRFLRLTWYLILILLVVLIFNWSHESILLEVIVTFYVQILVQRSISLLSCFDPIFCFYLAFYIALIPPLHRL